MPRPRSNKTEPGGDGERVVLPTEDLSDFMVQLRSLRETGRMILETLNSRVDEKKAEELIISFAQNMKERESSLSNCISSLKTNIQTQKDDISRIKSTVDVNRQTGTLEEKQLEFEIQRNETFLILVRKELKREDFYKQQAMEEFLGKCVVNGLLPGDSI